jgi:hypothetical protein
VIVGELGRLAQVNEIEFANSLEAALEVLRRKALPVNWAQTQMNLVSTDVDRIRKDWAENLERAITGYGTGCRRGYRYRWIGWEPRSAYSDDLLADALAHN